MKSKLILALGLSLALVVTACGQAQPTAAPTPDMAATIEVAAQGTLAALPTATPAVVTVEATVQVTTPPEVIVVTATPEPATATPAATSADGTQSAADATPLQVVAPPKNTTPVALNGPNPLDGMTAMLLQEYFDPPDFWETGDSSAAKISIDKGTLVIVNKQAQTLVWSLNGKKGRDFYAQVYVQPGICKYGDNYGLVVRATDEQNLTLYGISCEGRYRVVNIAGGVRTTILDWTESPYIIPMESTNVIGVRAVGDQFALYANNYYLNTITVPANANGRFGLYVGSVLTPNFPVTFSAVTAMRIGE